MNKKESFLDLLTSKTNLSSDAEGRITWEVGSPNDVENYVPNVDRVVRVIKTTYRNANVFYVEQKNWNYSTDYDTHYENVDSFVLVERNNQLVMNIYPAEIAEYVYERFSSAVVDSIEDSALADLLADEEE